ncbi:alpha/beta hydrolase family protein [Micromonospora eburnea]|uniref:Alpha/beta hydrolase family protein n=1 Tax=Micromonospora eburnea TaxID=227316 RepID=A0A1C6UR27_9ACTN|nr:alpha/beta hydrolase [Micromonospora eburnea]SCL56448.1 Alpha/beta hydrolase family protein [Micromonospora eburnea]
MRLVRPLLACSLLIAGLLAGCGRGDPVTSTSIAATPPAGVTERTVQIANGADRPLPTLLVHPTAAGRFPVVVFSHGYTRRPEDYLRLFRIWAKAGFIVAAPTFPHSARGSESLDDQDIVNQPGDNAAVLTAVLALDTTEGDPLYGHIKRDAVAAAGHSLGGMTTVGMFTRHRDDRLKAGIVLAGGQWPFGVGYSGAPAPILFVHGRQDTVVEFEGGTEAYEPLVWPKALLELPDGDHLAPYLGPDPDFDVVAAVTVDFLRWALLGDQPARGRMAGDAGSRGKVEDRL